MKKILLFITIYLLIFTAGWIYQYSRPYHFDLPEFVSSHDFVIKTQEKVSAGSDLLVEAGPFLRNSQDGEEVSVYLYNLFNFVEKTVPIKGGHIKVLFEGRHLENSGPYLVTVQYGNKKKSSALEVEGELEVDDLARRVGPKFIPADAKSATMLIALPRDRFGNPLPDGSIVSFKIFQTNQELIERMVPVQSGIAWIKEKSGEKAGMVKVSVVCQDLYSKITYFSTKSGNPIDFNVFSDKIELRAGRENHVLIWTDNITDKSGNIITGGSLVKFIVKHNDGSKSFYYNPIIKGKAQVEIVAPDDPGEIEVSAEIFSAKSNSIKINVLDGPAVGDIPVVVFDNNDNNDVVFQAGPFIGYFDEIIGDGLKVDFKIFEKQDENKKIIYEASSMVMDGESKFRVPRSILIEGKSYLIETVCGSGKGIGEYNAKKRSKKN